MCFLQVVAGLKDTRDRINSVKNTQKITDAMKLVAAAKVRRAQDAVVNGRPFAENLVKVSLRTDRCCLCCCSLDSVVLSDGTHSLVWPMHAQAGPTLLAGALWRQPAAAHRGRGLAAGVGAASEERAAGRRHRRPRPVRWLQQLCLEKGAAAPVVREQDVGNSEDGATSGGSVGTARLGSACAVSRAQGKW
jgi:hypothetical protein